MVGLGRKYLSLAKISLFLPTEQPKNSFSIPHFLSSLFSHSTKPTLSIEDSNYWATFPHEVYLIFPIKGYCIRIALRVNMISKVATLLVILCMCSKIFSYSEILTRSVSEKKWYWVRRGSSKFEQNTKKNLSSQMILKLHYLSFFLSLFSFSIFNMLSFLRNCIFFMQI